MPTLAGFNGSSLVPNIGGSIQQGLQIRNQYDQAAANTAAAQAQAAEQQRLQLLLGQIGGGQQQAAQIVDQKLQNQMPGMPVSADMNRPNTPQAWAKLAIQFPDKFDAINKNLGLITQQQKDEAADFAFKAANLPEAEQGAAIQQRAAYLQAQGRNPSDTLSLLDVPYEQRKEALQAVQVAALSPEKRIEVAQKGEITPVKAAELDIDKQTLDIRREENRQRSLDRAISRESNEIKRDELKAKLEQSKSAAEQKKRDIAFEAESAVGAVDDTLGTIDRMLIGDGLESAAGVSSMFPTVPGTSAANFEAQLETLQSQAFLSQVSKLKGMGALSENEGKKLASAIGSLNLNMGDAALREELGRIQAKLKDAKQSLKTKFNIADPNRIGRFSVEVVE